MSNFRDKVNSHLPIILQALSTASLVVIALSAICGSQSLKKLADAHEMNQTRASEIQKDHHSN